MRCPLPPPPTTWSATSTANSGPWSASSTPWPNSHREPSPRHPGGRRLLFLGDYIDSGPDSRGVLRLIRRLVDAGVARAILGNHEFNFVSYHSHDDRGRPLRPHTEKNTRQLSAALRSFAGHEDEIPEWVEWMKGLPFFLDLGGLRVVHAAWVPGDIGLLAEADLHDRAFLAAANLPGGEVWQAVGRVVKGVELRLPEGHTYTDADGTVRDHLRVRWWGKTAGLSWEELAYPPRPGLPPGPADLAGLDGDFAYGASEPPVFFGHYKRTGETAAPEAPNVLSLDYGLGHGGPATAYRWSGENTLDSSRIVQVK